jgi:serine/threonine-protein phosphatase 2A regulatory subunit B
VVYNLLDVKPTNLDELDEVITKCEFHSENPNLFLYATSKGFLHICDIRESSNFQNHSSLKI